MKNYTEIRVFSLRCHPWSEYHAYDHHCTDLHSLGFAEIMLLCLTVYPLPHSRIVGS